MAAKVLILFVLMKILNTQCINDREQDVTKKESFIFWPDGVIPFYIESRHFDRDQQLAITSALARFTFKTCLQFKPVFEEPKLDRHVLVLENPHGIRKCVINTKGHAIEEPHRLTIGFECISSPRIDMMIMRALGFPFEHNRASRDIYIDVLLENIDQDAIELYTKELKLPIELRALPYDMNSVMHFEDREYSKNGHRTFIFKNPVTHQNRVGLSPTDLQKINIIYGPECKTRDRLAKLKICSNYPANKRRKREVDSEKNIEERAIDLNSKNDTNHPIEEERDLSTNLQEESEKNDTSVSSHSNENDTSIFGISRTIYPIKKNLKKTIKDAVPDGKKIVSKLGVEDLVQELVVKVGQIREIALKLAKNNATRAGDRDTEVILAIINAIYEFLDSISGKGDTESGCKSSESDYAYSTKVGKGECDEKKFYSTQIGSARGFTQLRPNPHTSTQYAKNKGRLDNKNKEFIDMSRTDNKTDGLIVRQKRNVNGTNLLADNTSLGVSSTPPSVKTGNRTEQKENEPRRTFMDRQYWTRKSDDFILRDNNYGIFDDQNIRIENYAAITLPQFGVIAKENINTDTDDEKEKIYEKQISITKMITKERITKSNIPTEPYSSNIKTVTQFGTTKKKYSLPHTVPLSQGNKDFYGERIWPEGTVYFAIENYSNYDLNDVRQRLEEVNRILQTYTCVQLQEINEDDKKKRDYIVLDTSADFVVGRVGGRQKFGVLELFEGGQHRQHAAMVVMNMLGFYFELSRHDRDEYVKVHMRHIRPDKLHHFEKLHADATLDLPYDYKSATHPAWQFWRRLGKSGISSVATFKDKDPDGKIMKSFGQNSRLLSKIDLVKINSIYGTVCFEIPNDI